MIICDRCVLVNASYFVIFNEINVDKCIFIILYVSSFYIAVLAGFLLNKKCYLKKNKKNRHTPVMVYDDLIINKHTVVDYNTNRPRPMTF